MRIKSTIYWAVVRISWLSNTKQNVCNFVAMRVTSENENFIYGTLQGSNKRVSKDNIEVKSSEAVVRQIVNELNKKFNSYNSKISEQELVLANIKNERDKAISDLIDAEKKNA